MYYQCSPFYCTLLIIIILMYIPTLYIFISYNHRLNHTFPLSLSFFDTQVYSNIIYLTYNQRKSHSHFHFSHFLLILMYILKLISLTIRGIIITLSPMFISYYQRLQITLSPMFISYYPRLHFSTFTMFSLLIPNLLLILPLSSPLIKHCLY